MIWTLSRQLSIPGRAAAWLSVATAELVSSSGPGLDPGSGSMMSVPVAVLMMKERSASQRISIGQFQGRVERVNRGKNWAGKGLNSP